MREYTLTRAREQLAALLEQALHDGSVLIRRRDGQLVEVRPAERTGGSPLDVPGLSLQLPAGELLAALEEDEYDMSSGGAADHFTVADLAQFEGRNGRHELLDGALIVTPLGSSRHQSLCLAIALTLRSYVIRERLDVVFAPGRVVVDERTALEPDVLIIPGPAELASTP